VNTEKKQVKTTNQKLSFMTTPSEAPLFYEMLPDLSERTAKVMNLSSKESTIDKVFDNYPVKDSDRELEGITIVSNEENKSPVQKNIQLIYDVYGYVTEWSAEVNYK